MCRWVAEEGLGGVVIEQTMEMFGKAWSHISWKYIVKNESIHDSGSTVLSMVSITEKLNWRPESSDSGWNYWGSLCILFLRKA